jgi:hypothetical protein
MGAFFVYQRGRFLKWYQFELTFDSLKKHEEFVVLNICERIGVRVPVDLSIFITWRIVAFTVAGEARACQNLEIGDLPFHLALSSLRNFHAVTVFFQLL